MGLNGAVAQTLMIEGRPGMADARMLTDNDAPDRDQDPDDSPETPLDEPRPPRIEEPPPQPDHKGPYVVDTSRTEAQR
jgi:hypothetical protein